MPSDEVRESWWEDLKEDLRMGWWQVRKCAKRGWGRARRVWSWFTEGWMGVALGMLFLTLISVATVVITIGSVYIYHKLHVLASGQGATLAPQSTGAPAKR
jgi:hypothetical protein